ncbi:hypothetical protein K1T71_011875 [Dendrolimus kikuchii]|uniref:Uncharacterized protein n=1 Tax=Dendrolimus kikuchii TaxID=765133 RepID=A0ACC1CMI7_9NEOP|nr:hypothetical protein K1T71_011875 [Dendrolimus kikuchii]
MPAPCEPCKDTCKDGADCKDDCSCEPNCSDCPSPQVEQNNRYEEYDAEGNWETGLQDVGDARTAGRSSTVVFTVHVLEVFQLTAAACK